MIRPLSILLLIAVTTFADSVADARAALEADIEATQAEIAGRQQKIAEARGALLERVDTELAAIDRLEAELADLEAAATTARERAGGARNQVAESTRLRSFLHDSTTEFVRSLGSRLETAEGQDFAAATTAVDILAQAAEQAATAPGPTSWTGQTVTADGRVRPASFARVGPLVYVVAGEQAGIATVREGSPLPGVFSRFPPALAIGIKELVETGAGPVPVDVSGGIAGRLAAARPSLFEHLSQGGVTMVPILALGLLCAVLAVYKVVALSLTGVRGATGRIADILMALRRGDVDEALSIARNMRRPLGPVICEGIEHRDAPKEHLEEILHERILAQLPGLERLLSPLAVCASVAPLLGLLGTVTGMIHTFRLITIFGTGNPKVLSSGISEALVTTEFGLMIAIPALLVHAYLSRRVRKTVAATEQAAIMFVNGLKLKLDEEESPDA